MQVGQNSSFVRDKIIQKTFQPLYGNNLSIQPLTNISADMFISFEGKRNHSKIVTDKELTDYYKLNEKLNENPDDKSLPQLYNATLPLLEKFICSPEKNMHAALHNLQMNHSPTKKQSEQINEIRARAFNLMSNIYEDTIRDCLPVEIRPDKFVPYIDKLVTESTSPDKKNIRLIQSALDYLNTVYPLLTETNKQRVQNIANKAQAKFSDTRIITLSESLQTIGEMFKNAELSDIYKAQKNYILAKNTNTGALKTYLEKELQYSLSEINTPEALLETAKYMHRIDNSATPYQLVSVAVERVYTALSDARNAKTKLDIDYNKLAEYFNKDYMQWLDKHKYPNDAIKLQTIAVLTEILEQLTPDN